MALVACFGLAPDASAAPFMDLHGDTVMGAHNTYDIASIDAQYTAVDIVFTITLVGTPLAPSANALQGLSGFIDIDTDSNPSLGALATIDTIGGSFGSTGLGIEYYLDLFTEATNPGFVSLKDPINITTVQVPISYGANSVSITVALSLLNNDDGLVNYAVAVGDAAGATDQALDPSVVQLGGQPASSSLAPIPEPTTALLFAAGIVWLGVRGRRRS